LELLHLCLSLGFEGKYRVVPNGLNTLEQLRGELYRLILSLRGDFERELSPRWRGIKDARHALARYVPLWVVAAASGAILILVYLGYAFAVNSASDPVYKELFALAKLEVPMVRPDVRPTLPAPQPVRLDRYQRLLAPEIARKMVEVVDDHTLRIYNSFASGNDRLRPDFVPMLTKIAKELENGQEQVLVTGHTDSQPMFSARFPSNWHLSNSRAKNVAALLLANPALAGRVRSEGRADTEALFPDDTPGHRALNRRVDILIK
ncbi:MAG: type / secretion system protein DotU family, partial [Proteobacteria bacterium]|nr:type / secretion system protein DotU family [Pseudomonadota bacterium]